MYPILESTARVVLYAKDVSINSQGIDDFCARINPDSIHRDSSNSAIVDYTQRDKIMFLLVMDSLNFCYWGEPKWTIEYQGNYFDGAYGMLYALKNARETGRDICDPRYLKKMNFGEASEIFKGNTPIPLLADRARILHEIGQRILGQFGGDIEKLIQEGKGETSQLISILTQTFPHFIDEARFDGQRVCFYKRVQLFVSDLHAEFHGRGIGKLRNIDSLTGFADYKIAQSLRNKGILEYSHALAELVDTKQELLAGNSREVEIRAATIQAVHLISKQTGVPDRHIDYALWIEGQDKKPDDNPYHRTLTTAY